MEQLASRVPLVLLDDDATVGQPVARFIRENFAERTTIVVIAEIDPPTGWNHILPSHRSEELERQLRRIPGTLITRLHLQT